MTIQDKIQQLRECLSNQENCAELSKEELESTQIILEEATKIFELGRISRMDPEIIEEVYARWASLLDSKLSLFSKFNQEAKRHI